jgi:hypothetical protein
MGWPRRRFPFDHVAGADEIGDGASSEGNIVALSNSAAAERLQVERPN